jgi:hypothetical protein
LRSSVFRMICSRLPVVPPRGWSNKCRLPGIGLPGCDQRAPRPARTKLVALLKRAFEAEASSTGRHRPPAARRAQAFQGLSILAIIPVATRLLERGEQGGIQAIPPTLRQSLTARLDRLGPAREVAQIGSVIGRGFSYCLLRAVSGMEDSALQAALERLADADIVLVQGLPPDSDYRFKHALIQDAAYENLLKSRRQAWHRRVAEALRSLIISCEIILPISTGPIFVPRYLAKRN